MVQVFLFLRVLPAAPVHEADQGTHRQEGNRCRNNVDPKSVVVVEGVAGREPENELQGKVQEESEEAWKLIIRVGAFFRVIQKVIL